MLHLLQTVSEIMCEKGAGKVKGVFHTKQNCQKYPETSGLAPHTHHVSHGARKNKRDLRQEKTAPVTKSVLPLQILHCLIKTKIPGKFDFPCSRGAAAALAARRRTLPEPLFPFPVPPLPHTRWGELSEVLCSTGMPSAIGLHKY